WVTSADGHVVTGSSVFTVQSAAGAAGDPAGEVDDQADPAGNQIADETSGEATTGVNPALWVVAGLAVLLIGGAVVLLRRGR
ncbi:copper resistance protein CopC, partial [Dietzia sp. DQ12-76]|nr:copper resistance protein CopC [Dietzia sp. DQ12-76]